MGHSETSPNLASLVAHLTLASATSLARQGHLAEAGKLLRDALEIQENASLRLLLGKCLAQEERFEEAIADWRRIGETDPEYPLASRAIARAVAFQKWGTRPTWSAVPLLVVALLMVAQVWTLVHVRYQNRALGRARAELEMLREEQVRSAAGPGEASTPVKDEARFAESDLQSISAFLRDGASGYSIDQPVVRPEDGVLSVSGRVPTEYVKRRLGGQIADRLSHRCIDTDGLEVTHAYVVQPGDNLASIALALTGAVDWSPILEANRDKISNPDRLTIGTTLRIP